MLIAEKRRQPSVCVWIDIPHVILINRWTRCLHGTFSSSNKIKKEKVVAPEFERMSPKMRLVLKLRIIVLRNSVECRSVWSWLNLGIRHVPNTYVYSHCYRCLVWEDMSPGFFQNKNPIWDMRWFTTNKVWNTSSYWCGRGLRYITLMIGRIQFQMQNTLSKSFYGCASFEVHWGWGMLMSSTLKLWSRTGINTQPVE